MAPENRWFLYQTQWFPKQQWLCMLNFPGVVVLPDVHISRWPKMGTSPIWDKVLRWNFATTSTWSHTPLSHSFESRKTCRNQHCMGQDWVIFTDKILFLWAMKNWSRNTSKVLAPWMKVPQLPKPTAFPAREKWSWMRIGSTSAEGCLHFLRWGHCWCKDWQLVAVAVAAPHGC